MRPVDYKWNYRSDYKTWNDSTRSFDEVINDGSKTRTRYHHGLIAQEVGEVIDETGIDFGGYQDHKVNGGDDMLSLGYTELIAPMIKAIQEQSAMIEELKKEIALLKGGV